MTAGLLNAPRKFSLAEDTFKGNLVQAPESNIKAMKYALLQQSLDIPALEKLKRAFRSSQVLTEYDAHILGNDAFGILVRDLSPGSAAILQNALHTEGIETEMVEESLLPKMPDAKIVRKIIVTPEALMLHDALGRPFPLPWQHIRILAAGNVKLTHFKEVRRERVVSGGDDYSDPLTVVDYSTREETAFHFLLEIILTNAVLRYSINADKPFLFQNLGARFDRDLSKSFALVVQDVCQHTTNAVLNRGAYFLRERKGEPFSYPSKNAFYEEITWLLWRLRQAP